MEQTAQATMKKAIVMVSFGTSYLDNCRVTIGAVEKAVQDRFPEYTVCRAFTSGMIRRKLRERDGIQIDGVGAALERLYQAGYQKVLVQPTHVMNGTEYDKMAAQAEPFRGRFHKLICGKPLLSSTQDYQELVSAVQKIFPLERDTLLVLMGHGTEHFANAAYAALAYHFWENGGERVLVGTVEGYPGLSEVLKQAVRIRQQEREINKVVLAPLMLVAGDHANNDMAGKKDSWYTAFSSEGFQVECVLKGLGEYEEIRELYVKHTENAISELDNKAQE